MAVVFEGFSIREYASKMRSINVSKCWPFDEEEEEEENETTTKQQREVLLLPPITCKKYRWWGNEAVKSTSTTEDEEDKPVLQVTLPLSGFENEQVDLGIEKPVLICPVCQIFKASTVNEVNVHVDSCLGKEPKLMVSNVLKKSKILKKRSIVEIFAVAPQIKTVEDDDDTGEEEEENKSKMIIRNLKVKNKKKKKKKNKINGDGNGSGGGGAKLNLKKERHQKRQEQGDAYDPICLSDMDSDDVWIIEKEDPSLPQDQSCMDSYECIDVEENRRKVKRGTQDFDDAVDPITLSDMESDDLWIIEKENPSLPQDPALMDIDGNFTDVEQVEERKRKRKEKVQELDFDEEIRHQNARASDLQIHSDE